MFVHVEAVNEFHPQFVNAPYARSVSEVWHFNISASDNFLNLNARFLELKKYI